MHMMPCQVLVLITSGCRPPEPPPLPCARWLPLPLQAVAAHRLSSRTTTSSSSCRPPEPPPLPHAEHRIPLFLAQSTNIGDLQSLIKTAGDLQSPNQCEWISFTRGVKKVHLFACFMQNHLLKVIHCNMCKHKKFFQKIKGTSLSLSCTHSPNTLDTLDTQWSIYLIKYTLGVLIFICSSMIKYTLGVLIFICSSMLLELWLAHAILLQFTKWMWSFTNWITNWIICRCIDIFFECNGRSSTLN
jgi:hypothetical protein